MNKILKVLKKFGENFFNSVLVWIAGGKKRSGELEYIPIDDSLT